MKFALQNCRWCHWWEVCQIWLDYGPRRRRYGCFTRIVEVNRLLCATAIEHAAILNYERREKNKQYHWIPRHDSYEKDCMWCKNYRYLTKNSPNKLQSVKNWGGHFELCKWRGSRCDIKLSLKYVHMCAKTKLYARFGSFVRHGNDNSLFAT